MGMLLALIFDRLGYMEKRKLSEVFLEFIEPALQYFGNPQPRTQFHDAACALGHVVWNAIIRDDLDPETKHLTKARGECVIESGADVFWFLYVFFGRVYGI